jgi:DNA mismatch repair ATPase MutS
MRIGMVCIDTASGDIVYDEWEDGELRQNLASRVAHLQPRELLLPKGLSSTTSKLLKRLVAPLALSQATAVRSDLCVGHYESAHRDCQQRHDPPREALCPAQSREEQSTA